MLTTELKYFNYYLCIRRVTYYYTSRNDDRYLFFFLSCLIPIQKIHVGDCVGYLDLSYLLISITRINTN